MVATRRTIRLWSGNRHLFMLTGPDEETAGWIGRRLVGRTHKGKTVTRADVMHGLNVIHTITLDDVFPLHQADPTRPAATVAAVE